MYKDKRTTRYICIFVILSVLLIALMILNVCLGSVKVPVGDIFSIITGTYSKTLDFRPRVEESIIMDIRLPRVLAALLLGGALAVSGYLLQTFFANPIAGPFILGISSGAKLMVAVTMVFFISRGVNVGSWNLISAAFVGALISTFFILLVSGKTGNSGTLIICGVMIGYICSAVTELIVTFADDSNIVNLHNWSMGSFSGMTWENVKIMAIIVFVTIILLAFLVKPISAYLLGESYAASLGIRVKLFRTCLILISSILSACVTAFAGPISFVGVAVPHVVRKMMGTSNPRIVIPASFLGGAVFCLISDILARLLLSPTELSISTVTAVFGAPIVIWIMLGKQRKQS